MMSNENQLIVVERREVDFYGDKMMAVKIADGTIYVPLRPICEALGVDWTAQYRRLKRDEILSRVQGVAVMATPGGNQAMIALPLQYLNGWLFGISGSRVKAEVRERLLQYKLDCYNVLYEAFQLDQVTARPDPLVDELLAGNSAEARAYQMAMAVANMAREQLLMRQRLESSEGILNNHEQRLQILEAGQGDDARFIDEGQAVEISQAVKMIATELTKRSGRNQFGSVYGELYRRMEVTSYKRLPAARFLEAMDFLRQWWQSLTDQSSVPF